MKRSAVPMAMLAAGALAQELTTTITYSVCPTATTTTITLPTTITYCPGGFCNVTPSGGVPGATITTTATTTSYITVYPAPCPDKKGMCDASYTIWEECPCTEHGKGYIPKDFTTTLHKCNSCGKNGEPTEYMRTAPCTTGAYATVTPSYGEHWKEGPHPEIPIEDGKPAAPVADAKAGDAPKGAAHGAPVADAESGDARKGAAPKGAAPGAPVADAEAGAAPAGGKPAVPVANAEAGAAPAGGKPAVPVANAEAGAAPAGGKPAPSASGKPAAPVADAQAGGKGGKGVADYTGAANKAAFALSAVFAGVVGALAMVL